MINIVVGTSGHVDHGKTWLIKALTGTNTDRLKEEQKRGITIENGFADMTYGDYNISFIDVPGHERFVHNMLAGIGGIDMVLLVVDIEEGVMPQTREHFDILKMLKIENGIVVLTKNDATDDEDWKELVEEDVRSLLEGSSLENSEVIRVSSATGENIEALRALIVKTADGMKKRRGADVPYRLPVDRVFTIEGFGTVVTGTSIEGTLKSGDEIMIYPQKKTYKVRNIQVHNEFVDVAFPGQRTAINLAGAKKDEISRGNVAAAPGSLEPSIMLDVEMQLFEDTDRRVENGSRVHFFCGASEGLAKVVLLDREVLSAGEKGYAQLRFDTEIAVKKGDRYIIRFYSPMISIGGGVIIDAAARKAKRFDEKILKRLSKTSSENIEDVFESTVEQLSVSLPDISKIAAKVSLSQSEAEETAKILEEKGDIIRLKGNILVHRVFADDLISYSEKMISEYHASNPLSAGMKTEELRTRIMAKFKLHVASDAEKLLEILRRYDGIKFNGDAVSLSSFEVRLDKESEAVRKRLTELYKKAGFDVPATEEAISSEKDKKKARDMIAFLAGAGELKKINNEYYMYSDIYSGAFNALVDKIRKNGSITLAEFRDIIGTSRKYAVMFLEHLDSAGITRKVDDARVLIRDNF